MRLASIFTDSMVLQQGQTLRIWGFGQGEGSISFAGHTVPVQKCESSALREGDWEAFLPAVTAGGPYTLTAALAGEVTVLQDVLVGEVFLAGGQSNMDYAVKSGPEGRLRPEDNLMVRLYQVRERNDMQDVWKPCTKTLCQNHTAIGVSFGAALQRALGVPVGIVQCAMGAARVEAWTEKSYILGTALDLPYEKKQRDIRLEFNETGYLWTHRAIQAAGFAMAGVLWYQGESNRGDEEVDLYGALFARLLDCWRDAWQYRLPFFTVQLAAFFTGADEDDNWAHIREQQLWAAQHLPGVTLTTIGDLGEPLCIHPLRKRQVGIRLAQAALARLYGRTLPYTGPLYRACRRDGAALVLDFDFAEGLQSDGPVADLWIRGDGAYLPAESAIVGNSLRVWHPDIAEPKAVHYAWRNCPEINLTNGAGLPASPFRTDSTEGFPVHSESAPAP